MALHTIQPITHKPVYQYGNGNRKRSRSASKNNFKHISEADDDTIKMVIEEDDDELRCPYCRITYMSKLSIKNHVQVCKDKTEPNSSFNFVKEHSNNPSQRGIFQQKKTNEGILKLNLDEKKSLKILEESCFSNMDRISYESINLKEEKRYKHALNMNYRCEECDEEYSDTTKFARHCYAHTFIKTGRFFHCSWYIK